MPGKKSRCHSSSFVQDILCQDSVAGVAVVDLFVAIKHVKDNLDLLTVFNNDVFSKIDDIKNETVVIRDEYEVLLGDMRTFFDKLSVEAQGWTFEEKQTSKATEDEKPCEEGKKNSISEISVASSAPPKKELRGCVRCRSDVCQKSCPPPPPHRIRRCESFENNARGPEVCSKCGRNDTETKNPRSHGQVMVSAEALAEALLTTVLRGRKRGESGITPARTIRDLKTSLDKQSSEGSLDISESAIQIICDVCEILSSAEPREFDREDPQSSRENCEYQDAVPGKEEKVTEVSGASQEDKEDTVSEGESEFEEALSEPFFPGPQKAKPSVTCMGDLRAVATKKSVSTLTATNEIVSSWIGRLKEEIKSKVRSLKSGKEAAVDQAFVTSDKVLKEHGGPLEFTITANTPIGVFDVTIKQYRNRRNRSSGADDRRHSISGSANERLIPTQIINLRDGDFYWSDESLNPSDSDRTEICSNSGEDEMEEFLEISFENLKKDGNAGKTLPKGTGTLAKATLKTDKPNFFELTKYQPRYFKQEIIPKMAKEGRGDPVADIAGEITEINTDKGRQTSQLVIKDSSNDLLIYIQVQVEEEEEEERGGDLHLLPKELPDGKEVQVHEEKEICVLLEEGVLRETKPPQPNEKAEGEKTKKELVVAEEQLEEYVETELWETTPEEDVRVRGTSVPLVTLDRKLRTTIHVPQYESLKLYEYDLRVGQQVEEEPKRYELPDTRSMELENALNLIREIENNVVDINLSDAILILPQLESELRKHLQRKMKGLGEREENGESSVDNFFSAVDFWPDEESIAGGRSEDSEERLENLLQLLSDLEEAVKANEYSRDKIELCDYNSSKIYKLLHALTNSIRELEEGTNVVSMAETMLIASQLDTAVREYDNLGKDPSGGYIIPDMRFQELESRKQLEVEREESPKRENMNDVRKKVFQLVEEQAIDTEGRLEKDFDKVDNLERENEEAIRFLEAFLEKTQRRTAELGSIKMELRQLSAVLNSMYQELVKLQAEKNSRPQVRSIQSRDLTERCSEVPLRNTISGLLTALDSLKTRAREKNEACQEILSGGAFDKTRGIERLSRTSRSSFTAKPGLVSYVIEFKRIGEKSLYLSWTKPEGTLSESIVGYEILVNDKLNQKVRNPQRLQAVLYSVDLTQRAEIELHALFENGARGLLIAMTYSEK